jgi:hypothetical protein
MKVTILVCCSDYRQHARLAKSKKWRGYVGNPIATILKELKIS